jgi:hypothetical protein
MVSKFQWTATVCLFFIDIHFSCAAIDVDKEVAAYEKYLRDEKEFPVDKITEASQSFKKKMKQAQETFGKPGLFGPEFTFVDKKSIQKFNEYDRTNETGTTSLKLFNFLRYLDQKYNGNNSLNREIQDIDENTLNVLVNKYEQENPNIITKYNEFFLDEIKITYEGSNGYKISIAGSHSWYFTIGSDEGVVEVTTQPENIDSIGLGEKHQKHIFNFLNYFSLVPDPVAGGGHIHLDVPSVFLHSSRNLRNMYVDLENHPAIFLGGIAHSFSNSPLAIETKESRAAFKLALTRFDNALNNREKRDDTEGVRINRFASLMNSSGRKPAMQKRLLLNKSHAFNAAHLEHINEKVEDNKKIYTLEVRGFNPQKNARIYALQVKLLQARASYLEKSYEGRLVPYLDKTMDISLVMNGGSPIFEEIPGQAYRMPKIINKQQSVDEFYEYVTESGLLFEEFKELLDPRVQSLVPTKLKLELKQFIIEARRIYCEQLKKLDPNDPNCNLEEEKFLKKLDKKLNIINVEHCTGTHSILGKSEALINELNTNLAAIIDKDLSSSDVKTKRVDLNKLFKVQIENKCRQLGISEGDCKSLLNF